MRKNGNFFWWNENNAYLCNRKRKDGGIAQLVRAHDS